MDDLIFNSMNEGLIKGHGDADFALLCLAQQIAATLDTHPFLLKMDTKLTDFFSNR